MAKSSRNNPRTECCVGFHAVEALITHSSDRVVELLFEGRNPSHRQKQILALAKSEKVSIRPVSREVLEQECGSTHHQSVVAILESHRPKRSADLESVLESVDEAGDQNSIILMLDQVQDPHNLGACLRTAECAGVRAVILPKDGACPVNQTVRKVASGAAENLDIIYVPNLVTSMKKMQESGYWIYGTSDQGDTTIYDCGFKGRIGIVMGAEGTGIRRLTAETCDYLVKIPLLGTVSSLNVSVATGVTLFEVCRQVLAN